MFSGPSTKRSEAEGSCNPICDGGGNGVVENRDRLQIVRSSVERYARLLNAHLSCKSKAGANRWSMVEVQLIRSFGRLGGLGPQTAPSQSSLVLQPLLDFIDPPFARTQRGNAGVHRVLSEHQVVRVRCG